MIDISRLSPAELDRFLHMQGIVDRQNERHAELKALRAYYYGNHPVLLTQRQQEFLGPMFFNNKKGATDSSVEVEFTFAHNLVRSVVDTLRERLKVIGFVVNGESADGLDEDDPVPEAQLAALLWSWWNANRMDSEQIRLYRRTLRDSKSYVIVDFDSGNNRPRMSLHKADDGKTGVTYHRDPTDNNKVLFACRYFYTYDPLKPGATGIQRKTVFLPHETRKYIMRGSGQWEAYADEDGAWPLPWRDAQGNPLGVQVFEFENPGGSEMAQIIGLQNAVNKSWLDVLAGADANGFPMLVAEYPADLGIPPENEDDDLEGTDENRIGPGRMFEIAGTLKRLEAANLDPMLNVVWALVAAVAGVTHTPPYRLKPSNVSENVSGETLKMLDSGLVKRAEERQLIFGQSWVDVMAMCIKVARTFGTEQIPELETLNISTTWASAEVRNEKSDAETAQILQGLGVPKEALWLKVGYEPDEISTFKQNERTERMTEIASISEALRTSQQRQQQGANGNGVGNAT